MSYDHALLAIRIIIAVIVFAVFCGLTFLVPEVRSGWILRREKRAIAKRNAAEAKRQADMRKWCLRTEPPRIKRHELRRYPQAPCSPAVSRGFLKAMATPVKHRGVTR